MSTCISRRARRLRTTRSSPQGGLSVLELLLALALALCLAVSVAPLWVSFQSLGVREGDQTVWTMQARVAVARFERDLRLASAAGSLFSTGAAVLQAAPSQIVLLVRSSEADTPIIAEWEIVGGSLMRRWGRCPTARPASFAHSLYIDNKTMLEDVDPARSRFVYRVGGVEMEAPISSSDLDQVDAVTLQLEARPQAGAPVARSVADARVGR